ncbi:MAG: ion channel [Alphaproteobacteria bacterium]
MLKYFSSKTKEMTFKQKAEYYSQILSVIASLILIVSISLDTFSNTQSLNDDVYLKIQFWICIYFLVNIMFMWHISQEKHKFFLRWIFIFLLSIPYTSIFSVFELNLSDEALYLLRFIPLIRGGAALAILVFMMVKSNATGIFISYMVLLFSTIYFLSLIFYVFELSTNVRIETYSDVLWWASMTVTTVGSDILPVTAIGKISATLMAVVGMTFFPIFTVYITSVVQDMNKKG